MKTEPDAYSIDTLKKDKTGWWDGVRNYQARNYMMNEMQVGDEILFYHSSTKPPGVAGLATVSKEAAPDITAQDSQSNYYDAKASPEKPIWYCVQVKFKKKFKNYVSLSEIREEKSLAKMLLIKKGMRLSIQPVTAKEYQKICKMGGE